MFPEITPYSPNIIAIGGDMLAETLKLAYQNGIFPWYDEKPILWYAPDPRFVLFRENLKISKSMRKLFRENTFTVSYNTQFEAVMRNCQQIRRKDQNGTWIQEEMITAYTQLHKEGWAKSVEVWNEDQQLIGGLYGIELGKLFCGESMFSLVPNASKYGFIQMLHDFNYEIIDCQVYTKHLESLGAIEISRSNFLKYLPKNHP